jgi:hypothetical protein
LLHMISTPESWCCRPSVPQIGFLEAQGALTAYQALIHTEDSNAARVENPSNVLREAFEQLSERVSAATLPVDWKAFPKSPAPTK